MPFLVPTKLKKPDASGAMILKKFRFSEAPEGVIDFGDLF